MLKLTPEQLAFIQQAEDALREAQVLSLDDVSYGAFDDVLNAIAELKGE